MEQRTFIFYTERQRVLAFEPRLPNHFPEMAISATMESTSSQNLCGFAISLKLRRFLKEYALSSEFL